MTITPSVALHLRLEADLHAALEGDRDAYARVVTVCQNSVTAIALSIVRDVPTSEDIAQEAFLSAWQHLRRLQNPASFLPWLRQITRNLARDHLRSSRRRPPSVDMADQVIADIADPSEDACGVLIRHERQVAVDDLISALPADSREVLLLYYREGQRTTQVAGLLGLSDATVRKRLSRAREQVRAGMLERFAEFARGSAPSAAFTAVVAGALTMASPPVSAFGVLSATIAGGAKTAGYALLGAAGSIAFALVAGLAGIWLSLRAQLQGVMDHQERHDLVRSAVVCALASIGFVACIILIAIRDSGWFWPTLATLVFMTIVFWQAMVVQPRAMRRRHAHEARIDPEGAARDRKRERFRSRLGMALGMLFGLGGLLGGLVLSGRL